MRIEVKSLLPNPFRSLDRYPIRKDKVDALKQSINTTTFWDNLLARKNGKGFELAYGHHRLKALQALGIKDVDIPVRNLDDETMLKIMASENMEEWGASAAIEQETIRSVVQAFAEGKVKLPQVKSGRDSVRCAPSFVVGAPGKLSRDNLQYSAASLAKFLGWPEAKVAYTLNALALIEEGVGKDIDFTGLSPKQAEVVVRETKYVRKATKSDDVAAEIGSALAEEFRSPSGNPHGRSKKDQRKVSIHTARDRTESMLFDVDVNRFASKERTKRNKAELENKNRQVKEFMDSIKIFLTAMEAATRAVSKFSPEARKFTVRRLDLAIAAAERLKEALK